METTIVRKHHHFLMVTFPAQGHINPTLQFAKRLIRTGAQVTLATAVSAHRRITKPLSLDGLSLATYSDGYDDGFKYGDHDPAHYMSELRRRGTQSLNDLIGESKSKGSKPYTCLVYSLLLPWAAKVAREHHLPAVLLWIQPATVLDIYYYYFNGCDGMFENFKDPSYVLKLPKLPPLKHRDIPSFLIPSDTYTFVLPEFKEQLKGLSEETNPKVLVNTFDALEPEALKSIENNINLIGIGPLIPSAFLDGKDPSDKSFGGDLFHSENDHNYIEFLNSKPKASVVYVSFGSISVLSKRQTEEIARGLVDSGRPFLWVIREEKKPEEEDKEGENYSTKGPYDAMSLIKDRLVMEGEGKIVPWCSQVEVLSHASTGCFITHCGWNSTLEGLVSGVPMVGFPQWTDQGTNAMLMEEVWKVGVRVVAAAAIEEEGGGVGIVGGDEIRRCLDLVMGSDDIGEEMRSNALKWKELAREAVRDGGSSDSNFKAFLDAFGDASL